MPAITPAFMFDLESNMRVISCKEYDRLSRNLWWDKIAKRIESTSRKERITWLLDTARIQRTGRGGGNLEFEDIVSTTTEIEAENAAAGLKIKKEEFEDHDGNGIQFAAHWARQIGSYGAYWPQKQVARALLSNPVGYDQVTFFHATHPVNPFDTAAGTFANVFTGAAAGIYPGAVPIDSTVTVDQAVANIAKILAYVAAIKMPNGEDPRYLKLASIFVPPTLTARAQQITNAKYIAQAAGSAAGSGDVEAVIRNFGLGQPVEIPELSSAFGGSDTDYYLAMEEITGNELGAFNYVEREPFSVLFYGPQSDAQLARIREFQWSTEGRNTVSPGHPYLLFKCRAT